MNIKPGILVMLLWTPNPVHRAHAGEIHLVGEPDGKGWRMDPPIIEGGLNLWWREKRMRQLPADGITESEVIELYSPCKTEIAEAAESIKDHFALLGTQAIRGSTGRGA